MEKERRESSDVVNFRLFMLGVKPGCQENNVEVGSVRGENSLHQVKD